MESKIIEPETIEQETASEPTQPLREEPLPNSMEGEAQQRPEIDWGTDRDVSLAELEGLPVFEQFLLIWGTPERGKLLWEAWLSSHNETTRQMLNAMATDQAQQLGVSLEEMQTRMAVEKMITDRGINLAANYIDRYKVRKLKNSRTLKPLVLGKKRKR
jgi:hypothetical protein